MKENRAFSRDQDLNVVWSTETEASRITEHKDDPEEESTQSDEGNSKKSGTLSSSILESSMTQRAEAPTVKG